MATLLFDDSYYVTPIGRSSVNGGRFQLQVYLQSQSGNTSTVRFVLTQYVLNGYSYDGFPIKTYLSYSTNDSQAGSWEANASTLYASDSPTVRLDKTVTLTHNSSGQCNLAFWWSNADSSGISPTTYYYVPSNGNSSGSVNLPVTNITITFNDNGGSGGPGSQSVTPGVSTPLSSTTPTRAQVGPTGSVTYNANGGTCSRSGDSNIGAYTTYAFSSWNSNSQGTGTNYTPGTSYTWSTATTIYAKWTSSSHTNTITLPTAAQCTRSGYTLLGWSTSSTATVASYAPGASYSSSTANVVLYAVWQMITYTISYDANGGTGAPTAQTTGAGGVVTLSGTTPTKSTASTLITATFNANGGTTTKSSDTGYKRTNYTFSYWYYNGNQYQPSTQYTFNSNATLSARYNDSTTYATGTTPTAAQCTRTHYTLLGWATSSSATTATYAPGQSITLENDVVLYAVWQENAKQTVTFDAAGGTGAPSSIEYYVEDGVTIPATTPTKASVTSTYTATFNPGDGTTTKATDTGSTRLDYTFDAWVDNVSGSRYLPDTFYRPNANLSLVANYTDNTVVTQNITTPTTQECTREGYMLMGWLAQGTSYLVLPGTEVPITADTTYTAVWGAIPVPVYTQIHVYEKTANGWELQY